MFSYLLASSLQLVSIQVSYEQDRFVCDEQAREYVQKWYGVTFSPEYAYPVSKVTNGKCYALVPKVIMDNLED